MFLARSSNASVTFQRWSTCKPILAYSTVPEKCPYQGSTPPPPVKSSETVSEEKKLKFIDTPEEYAKAKPLSEMPGPSAFELIRNTVLPSGKYYKAGLKQIHAKLHSEYGSVVKFPALFGRESLVFLYDADQVERVFRNEGQYPNRRSFDFIQQFREKYRPELFKGNGGLLQEQGVTWQNTRTKVNPVMMQPKTVTRYIGVVDTIAGDFVNRIRSIRDDKQEVPADFGNEMNKWALESIAYVALNQRLGLLNDTEENSEGQRLIQSVHEFFVLSYELEVNPSFWKIYETPTYKKMMKCLNTMTDIIISYIDKSIAELEKKDPSSTDEESVFEKLLKIDKKVAIVMALDSLMAGVDTTSNTILTLLYFLAKNPEKQQLLRREIKEKMPTKNTTLSPESLKNMPYLRACIKESQRLEPVIAGTLRKMANNVVLGGYQVPKDFYVVMVQNVMCQAEKNYSRSRDFIPERFLKADPSFKPRQPFAFLPFGFGSRMCIGKRIAELEVEIVTAKLIRNFEVQWHYPEMQYGGNTFINAPTGDLKYKFIELED